MTLEGQTTEPLVEVTTSSEDADVKEDDKTTPTPDFPSVTQQTENLTTTENPNTQGSDQTTAQGTNGEDSELTTVTAPNPNVQGSDQTTDRKSVV